MLKQARTVLKETTYSLHSNTSMDDVSKHTLVKFGQTQFAERHVAVKHFCEHMVNIAVSLELVKI